MTVYVGWAVLALWLLAVNALVHIAQGLALQRYNLGMITAATVLLPMSLVFFSATPATAVQHLCAHLLVLAIQAAASCAVYAKT